MARNTTDAAAILTRELSEDPEFERLLAEEKVRSSAARAIYEARTAAGLTQAQLAEAIGTTQSVIARLESADYQGHTFNMLQRIAGALSRDVDVRLVPRAAMRA
jgi:ribosome-binding protein aMBF1 (putative translation factor)